MHLLLCRCSLLLLIFGLSLGSLQLYSSPDTNGSYCPGMVTFTCVGINVPFGVGWTINQSLVYTYTFENQGNEIFPEIVFASDIFTITVKYAVITSDSTQNITIGLSSNVSDLLQSTVSCRTATPLESDIYFILLSVPETPDGIRISAYYNLGTLSKINVFWYTMNNLCIDNSYQVILTNGSSALRSESVNCSRGTSCQVMFMVSTSQIFDRYIVKVVTLDFQGLAVNTLILPPIDAVSLFLPNISVQFFPCIIRCHSDLNVSGICEINFPDVSVHGIVNYEDIQIPESLQFGTVNYNATFNIDGRIYTFQNSDDVQYNSKWTAWILTCAILTPILCFLSVILIILLGIGLYKKKGFLGYQIIIVCTLLPSIIFVVVSISCWIAGLVEVSKTNDCNSMDQNQAILIAACCFSILSIIFDVTAIALVNIYNPEPKPKVDEPETWQNKNLAKNWKTNEMGIIVDEHGNDVVEMSIDSTSGHKCPGETLIAARLRVSEERTMKVKKLMEEVNTSKNETESNIYSQTEHVGPSSNQKKKFKEELNYSSMASKPTVYPEDRHYAKLQHNNSALVPPPGVFNTATTTSGGSMPLSAPAGHSQVGTEPSESTERSGSGPEYGKLEPQETAEQENMTRNNRKM